MTWPVFRIVVLCARHESWFECDKSRIRLTSLNTPARSAIWEVCGTFRKWSLAEGNETLRAGLEVS